MDYASDVDRVEIEEWSPGSSLMDEGSNLTDEELAELFSGDT